MRIRHVLLLLSLPLLSPAAFSQVEYHVQTGLFTGTNEVALLSVDDAVDVYTGTRYVVGVETLFGSGQVAPLAGLLFQPGRYRSPTAEDFAFHRLYAPLGVAYRLLSPQFDLNFVPSVAAVPAISFGDGAEGEGLSWNGRVGAALLLDWFTLGAYYWRSFGDGFGSKEHSGGRALLTAGVRF